MIKTLKKMAAVLILLSVSISSNAAMLKVDPTSQNAVIGDRVLLTLLSLVLAG